MGALSALCGIGECKLLMRHPGDWYLSVPLEKCEGHMLVSHTSRSNTPQEAVENAWSDLTGSGVPLRARDGARYRWSGYHWQQEREVPA